MIYTDKYGRLMPEPNPLKNKYPCTCKDGKVPAHLNGTPIDEIIWINCQICGGTGRTNIAIQQVWPNFSGYLIED